jgi:hypothetical protein
VSQAQNQGYERFGRIATAVVKEDYPGEKVVEYEYVGRTKVADNQVVDTFRYEVMKDGQPIFVLVKVNHDPTRTQQFSLSIEEQKKPQERES